MSAAYYGNKKSHIYLQNYAGWKSYWRQIFKMKENPYKITINAL